MNKKESKAIINYVLNKTICPKKICYFNYDDNGHTYSVEFKKYLSLEDSELFVKFAIQLGLSINSNNELSMHNERFDAIKFAAIMKFYTDFNVADLSLKSIDVLMHNESFHQFIMGNDIIDYEQANKLFDIAIDKMHNIYNVLVKGKKSSSDDFVDMSIVVLGKLEKVIDEISNITSLNNIDSEKLTNFIDAVSKIKNINEDKIISEIVKSSKNIND